MYCTKLDAAMVYHREAGETRLIALLDLFNGTFAVCDFDNTRLYHNEARARKAWHALVDEYADAGWSVEPA